MTSVLSKILKFNSLLVLGVFRTEDGNNYYTLNLKKKNNNLVVISTASYASVDEVIHNHNTNIPILLVIDGKGVLNKRTDLQNEADANWKNNIDFSSIHFTGYQENDIYYISFCRKKMAEEIIAEFQKKGLAFLDFYLGPLPAKLLQPVLKQENLAVNDSLLIFESDKLAGIAKKTDDTVKEYLIGDTTLSQYHLALYGAAVNHFVNNKKFTKSHTDTIDTESLIYKKSFNYLGAGMLITIFIALLSSYFLIQYYSSENLELNQTSVYSNKTLQTIIELENQKEQKLNIINETGQLSKNFLSYYIYELARSVPYALRIDKMGIFTPAKEIKANEKVALNSKIMIVKGSAAEEDSFNLWLNKLKDFKWIQKFEIISFKKDKKNIQQFEVKILINDF